MSRTSHFQHLMMLEFMERHGDLLIPCETVNGRLDRLRLWRQLAEVLNQEATGAKKSVEKWKKVWSDWKMNTKKKAAKINSSCRRTGGGPPLKLKLTDLEQRVLSIMGPEAATGLDSVKEVGLDLNEGPVVEDPQQFQTQEAEEHLVVIETIDDDVTPTSTSHSTPFITDIVEASGVSPSREQDLSVAVSPVRRTDAGAVPLRRVVRRPRVTPHRSHSSVPPRQHAAEMLLQSDEHWRQLIQELATEHLRLRELELQRQAEWQVLFQKMIDVLDKFNK